MENFNKISICDVTSLFFLIFSFSIPMIGYHVPKYVLGCLLLLKFIDVYTNPEVYKSFFVRNKIKFLFLSFFFMFSVFSFLYTDDLKSGFGLIANYLFFIIFQIIFISNQLLLRDIFKSFLYGILFLEFVNIGIAIYNFDITQDYVNVINSITYERLSNMVKLHPGYYSLMILISIFINNYFVQGKKKWLIFLFQACFLFFLASRLLLLLLLFFCIFLIFNLDKKYKLGVTGVILVCLFFLFKVDFVNESVFRFSNFDNALGIIFNEWKCGMEICIKEITSDFIARIYQIKSSLQLIFKSFTSFLFGYGIGDFKFELLKQYEVNNFEWGINAKFNSHNQYLSTMLIGGIFNLVALFIYIFSPLVYLKKSVYKKLYILIAIVFLLYSLTESFLLRENGVLVFTFFVSAFALGNDFFDTRKFLEKNETKCI
ncbi:O-antigen ligase family protein [uncultured Maribacter sp.]|uniref:O-antigen ligase family protein n=1 Tax=uncultured Maribacter sp. TaxID=431308 RepID=UPI0026236346|nr:O-antigen ligase family protein [uncultured Maribacter sp.]